jgi:hypothetical protein
MTTTFRRCVRVALIAGLMAPAPAYAQLDPLLFLKTLPPNVILAVDTANRMQRDADDTYYDPGTYSKDGFEGVLGVAPDEISKTYRRKYLDLTLLPGGGEKFSTTRIEAVGDLEGGYSRFFERTRLAIARRGMVRAIADNVASARFALIRMRQAAPSIATGNDQPVKVLDDADQQATGDVAANKWRITRNLVATSNTSQTTSGLMVPADGATANASVITILNRNVSDITSPKLVMAGADSATQTDAPLGLLLDDARAHASTLIGSDLAAGGCRNTVVVLIAGGGEGSISPQNLKTKAATFLNISGRRVPIYVVGLFPSVDEASALREVATESGGQYFEITKDMVEAAMNDGSVTGTRVVPEVVRAVNTAVQHAFVQTTTFNTAPTAALPYGPLGEYQVTSPIVGTVNLRGASKLNADGSTTVLPDSETYLLSGSTEIPQRSNVMVTSAFTLPGFDAKLRAFRVYKPIPDTSQPSGYRFVQDGTRLWENATPAAGSRNLYTVLPGSSKLVPFTAANVDALDNYLNVSDPEDLINYVRALPMGAIVGSTPAFLDVPSLDPPPDEVYPSFREKNKDRRALIFIGANDGMLHALDARTGLEVWGFVPFNLLPKLKALRYGQSLDAFKYFVDSSPKIADVKVDGAWRTYLFFGQGPGGTFYNTLDVTLDDIADSVAEDSTSSAALLSFFADTEAIEWKWSFPRLTSFDAEIATYGELSAAASAIEQSIGETWSDPAIGQVINEDGPYVMIVGSGYLKYSVQQTYRLGATRSGTTFYVFSVKTGEVLASKDVGADANAETLDDCRSANDCRKMKNALQMDPVATGPLDQRFITMTYIGDLDGNVWKFDFTLSGGTLTMSAPTALYNAGAEHPLFASMATVNVGGSQQYIFVGTGSDLLPSPDAAVKQQTSSLLVLLDTGATATKKAEILLEKIDGIAGEEKVTTFPAVAGDIVFFTTTTYNITTPCTPYSANLYAFTFIGGPAYDTNNDGKLSSGTSGSTGGGKKGGGGASDSQKVLTVAGKRATAPFIVDQHLVFSTDGTIQMFGNPNDFNNGVGQAGVRILSWRAVK